MKSGKFPQILLIGNGLNRAYGCNDWDALLKSLSKGMDKHPDSEDPEWKEVPYPLRAVILTGDCLDTSVRKKQTLFCGAKDKELEEMKPMLQRILNIGFDEILTTNYSYEFERAIYSEINHTGDLCRKFARHTDAVKRVDSQYLLHTYNEIKWNGKINHIWHIHGEARKPGSIILGHYYYANLLERYQKELEGRKNRQFIRQQKGEAYIKDSWLDAFIMGDVHVLGFGFDFSEFDLWWLLNRKEREKAAHGELHFYCITPENNYKLKLLEQYGAKIEDSEDCIKRDDYKEIYEKRIEEIEKYVSAQKG